METYKYIHIMLHGSNHNMAITQLINENPEFESKEHLFVIKYSELYAQCKEYDNVILDESISDTNMKSFSNYLSLGDYMFLHSHALSISQMVRINKNDMNKIIWCVWGHDLYRFKWKRIKNEQGIYKQTIRLLKNIILKVYELGWKYKTKQMYGVGIGFK